MKRAPAKALALTMILIAASPGVANAITMTVTYQATVSFIDASPTVTANLAASGVTTGAPFTGVFSLDTDLSPRMTKPSGSYTVGSVTGELTSSFAFSEVINTGRDLFFTTSDATANFPSTPNPQWGFQVVDSTGTALDSDSIPAPLPPLSAFDDYNPADPLSGTAVYMAFYTGFELALVAAEIDSYSATLVPLPGALALMLGAVAVLGGLRRTR